MQGLSLFTISDDLVVYGGDKSGLISCTMAGTDWKWAAPAITGEPLHFVWHASVTWGERSLIR